MLVRRWFRRLSISALLTFLATSAAHGQLTNVTNDQATPIHGVGHDYIRMLNETVNPANGQVSLRIDLGTPPARRLNNPVALLYTSSGVHHVEDGGNGVAQWSTGTLASGSGSGWSYSVPQLTAIQGTASFYNSTSFPPQTYTCEYISNYMFQDLAGTRHSLNISMAQIGDGQTQCNSVPSPPQNYLSGGDDFFSATTTAPGSGLSSFLPNPVTVTDADGTVYYFSNWSQTGIFSAYPTYIKDRNGNTINISSSNGTINVTDTVGRTAVSISPVTSGSNNVTVSGLANPLQLTWVSKPANFNVNYSPVPAPGGNCGNLRANTQPTTVVQSLTLPDQRSSYQFQYDGTYGLLSKITYPSGGYVSYSWNVNPSSEYSRFPNASGQSPTTCSIVYDFPAIIHRYVSFDGVSVALQQDFTYVTTPGTYTFNGVSYQCSCWTNKQTTVTTHDLVRNLTSITVYSYIPVTVWPAPNVTTSVGSGQTTLERTITYNDWGGSTLRTTTKAWFDQYLLGCELTTLDNGQISGRWMTYGAGGQLTDEKEFDYGLISSPTVCQNVSGSVSPPSGVTPTRETAITHQSFPSSPYIVDQPCQVDTYTGGATSPIAESQYFYDGGSSLCGTPGTPSVTSVANLPGGTHDETNFGPGSSISRGNLTKLVKLCKPNCPTSYPATTYTYDETGQLLSMTDACGNATCSDMTATSHATTYSYADNYDSPPTANTNAYLTKITRPPTNGASHIASFKYAYSDGQLISSTDQNSQTTQYLYNDPFRRLKETDHPDGGKTTLTYNDAPYNPTAPSPSVTTTKAINSSANLVATTAMDGLGHVVKTLLTDPDCASGDRTDSTYDGLGRAYTVTNPYCTTSDTNPPYGITTYVYDALGRATQLTHPDNSTVVTTHTGPAIQVQDEGNGTQRVTRISQTDGLGRIKSVCEVAPGPFVGPGGASSSTLIGSGGTPAPCGLAIPGTGFLTTYQYDALDNLLQVNQTGIAPRTFAYDSLSRLTSATNPESGTINYTYDANGNLATKVAPAPNQTGSATLTTTYTYDALNRLATKSYSDGETDVPTYYYDTPPTGWGARQNAIGRMTAWTTINCLAMAYDYDVVGRVVARSERQPSNCTAWHPITNTYDLMGNMTSQTDGNFHTASYTYNAAARILGVTDSQTTLPTNLLYNVHYNALGQITSDSTGYGEIEAFSYDNRGRQQSSTITLNGYPVYSFSITNFAPNGNVLAANDSSNGNWTYSYDQFNRLTGANQNSGAAVYNYVYDRLGNRWQQNGPHTFTATFTGNNPSNPANNNRIDGYTYDAAGNLIADGSHTYTYDAENRLIKVDGGNTSTFVYDGEGHRFSKTNSSSINSGGNTPDPIGTTEFVYDPQGHLVHTETPNGGTGWRGEVFAGNRHLATYVGNLIFAHADWLGTERNRDLPDPNNPQHPSNQNLTSLPFGDWLDNTQGIFSDWTPLNFTGQYHDFESNLDYFGARYYSNSTGRFISPDWSAKPQGVPYAVLDDPQSLNLYTYVRNNPLNRTDPDGHYELNASGCGDNTKCQKKWDKAANKFEARREKNLHSRKADVRAAAAAYGARGEANGVHVGFANLANQGIYGSVDASGSVAGHSLVQVTLDFGRAGNSETITHEGTHVGDDTKFLNSFNPFTGGYDQGLNITHGQTEFNAFKAGAEISREHGFGPNDDQRIWNFLRNSPTYGPALNIPVFDRNRFPAGAVPPNVPLPGAPDNEED